MRRAIFYFILFSPNEQRGGGGGRGGAGGGGCRQTFFFFFLWSADHERDWQPCKVVFRVGNQYAECEKHKQQQPELHFEAKTTVSFLLPINRSTCFFSVVEVSACFWTVPGQSGAELPIFIYP